MKNYDNRKIAIKAGILESLDGQSPKIWSKLEQSPTNMQNSSS
jgi:hypothetical protein